MAAVHQWAVQDAKARFSEMVKKASHEGPQFVAVRGKPAVVIISQADYLLLIAPKISLFELLRKSPLAGQAIKIERDKSMPRDVDL